MTIIEERQYTDLPNKLYQPTCLACNGSGLYRGMTNITDHLHRPYCFKCGGRGVIAKPMTYEQAVSRELRLRKAQIKRDAVRKEKQQAHFEQWQAEHRAKEAELKAQEEFRLAERRTFEWVGVVGDKLEGKGEVLFRYSYDTQWGSQNIVVIRMSATVKVKTFTTAGWSWEVSKGDIVSFKGTVKEHSMWEEEKTTVLSRVSANIERKMQP